jgi:hypothetical protein
MKTRYYAGFNFPHYQFPAARELFRRMGRLDLAEGPDREFGYDFEFQLEADFIAFREEALALGLPEPTFRKEYVYTRKEVLSAPLLWVWIQTSEKGYGGPTYGTEYDLSTACPQCGAGATQTSPLFLKRSKIPSKGDIFQTLDHERLVSPELSQALVRAHSSGLELRPVLSHLNGESLPWLQIIATSELPPMSHLTRGIVRSRPCPECTRDGHYHDPPVEIAYDAGSFDLSALPDFNFTYELFGNSRLREPFNESHFASPGLIIKPKVFEVFEKCRVRRVEFVPVRVVAAE